MKKVTKKISAMALSMVFGMMQVSASTIVTGDTGLGVGNGGAVIHNASGGYVNTTLGKDSATLNFNGNAHVNWDTLNVNKNETLNFNAMNPNGNMTVVNTVNSGMSNIYGAINSNEGISNLIISNPNGMLFDGATFTTAGNLLLTTQALSVNYANGNLDISGLQEEATNGIIIRDGADKKSNFNIGGEFNIVAPSIEIAGGYIGANKGLNLITKDGQNYLLAPSSSNNYLHKAVVLKAVNIDGDVYILSGEDVVAIAHGGKIVGDLKVDSKGNVGLNYENAGKVFEVTGNVDAKADGKANILRKGNVGGNLSMSNSGGYVEILSSDVNGNVDLKTTIDTNPDYKHFVHVVGENNIGGNLNIDSVHNIHVGGYEGDLQTHIPGNLNVAGDINAYAKDGSIAVTTDVKGNKVSLTSENLNIVSDGIATITAKEYELQAKHYIGGVNDSNYLINTVMEKYTPIERYIEVGHGFVNIAGGEVTKIEQDSSSYAFLKSQGNMNVDNVDAGRVYITSNKDIVIKDNVKADTI